MRPLILIREIKRDPDPRRGPWLVASVTGVTLLAILGGNAYRREIASKLVQIAGMFDPPGTPAPDQRPPSPPAVPGPERRPPPAPPAEESGCIIRAHANAYGHYFLDGTVNGLRLNFMVDSGSTFVALPQGVARQLGFRNLVFDIPMSTANGVVYDAKVQLRKLAVGPFVLSDFPATVNGGELDAPLLGVSWLRLFKKVDIVDGVMTLRC